MANKHYLESILNLSRLRNQPKRHTINFQLEHLQQQQQTKKNQKSQETTTLLNKY